MANKFVDHSNPKRKIFNAFDDGSQRCFTINCILHLVCWKVYCFLQIKGTSGRPFKTHHLLAQDAGRSPTIVRSSVFELVKRTSQKRKPTLKQMWVLTITRMSHGQFLSLLEVLHLNHRASFFLASFCTSVWFDEWLLVTCLFTKSYLN